VKTKAKAASLEHVAILAGQAVQELAESYLKPVLQVIVKAKAASLVHDAVLAGHAVQAVADD
jgi:hypothetical protein